MTRVFRSLARVFKLWHELKSRDTNCLQVQVAQHLKTLLEIVCTVIVHSSMRSMRYKTVFDVSLPACLKSIKAAKIYPWCYDLDVSP